MTMTGGNATMSDEFHPERLVDDSLSPKALSPVQEAIQAIKNFILPTHRELIEQLRIPTPQKVSNTFTVTAAGTIGGGLTAPAPLTVYTCPVSVEAWLHRVTFSSPGNGPANPLKTGQIVLYGTQSGELLYFLPQNGIVAPVQFTEGRASAAHLNSGETIGIVGDTLPAGTNIRIDLQFQLISIGVSPFTPNLPGITEEIL